MILDVNSILSNQQAITVTAPSTGTYDTAGLGVGVKVNNIFGTASVFGQDVGAGGPYSSGPQLGVFITTTFTAGGSATMTFALQAAIDDGTGNPGTWDTIMQSDALAVALLTTNLSRPIVSWSVPDRYPGQGLPRFYRVNYTVATGPMTAGAVTANLLTGIDDVISTPANF